MADIELVIKLPKRVYNYIRKHEHIANGDRLDIKDAIVNGTQLPKGHKGLVDVQDVVGTLMWYKEFGNADKPTIRGCIDRIKNHIKPIIEADKECEDKE